jgi:hypothetical protein
VAFVPGDDLRELLDRFEQLVAEHGFDEEVAPDEGVDNFRCDNCVRCANCRFCTACEDCSDCTYCDACLQCEGCTQSRECVGCVGISHSAHCGYCEGGSHQTLCYDCRDCVQCFACVGMTGAEFHILNVKYARRDYFKKVGELRKQLDALALEGWFPPWIETESESESESVAESEAEPESRRPSSAGSVYRSGPADAGTSGSTLSSLLTALEATEIETEPLDPDQLFDAEASCGAFPGVAPARADVPRPSDVSLDDLDLDPPKKAPEVPPAKPPAEPPETSEEPPAPTRPPGLLTRGVRPPRR